MRTESSIVELEEIASGMAIAASVSEVSDSSCRSDLRSVKVSQRWTVSLIIICLLKSVY